MVEGDGGASPGGEGTGTAGSADGSSPGGLDDKALASADTATLLKVVQATRTEAATYRTRATKAETDLKALTDKVTALENASKTQEQKDAEARQALETTAARVPALQRFESYVKSQYDAEMKTIEGMKAGEKKLYMELLATLPEDDLVGRVQALNVLKQARVQTVPPGNEGSPAENGGGANEASLAQKLGWSASGTREAQIGGLLPVPTK